MTMDNPQQNQTALELSVQELADISGGILKPGPVEELENNIYTTIKENLPKQIGNVEIDLPDFGTPKTY